MYIILCLYTVHNLGEDQPVLQLSSLTLENAGIYHCVVSTYLMKEKSTSARISVNTTSTLNGLDDIVGNQVFFPPPSNKNLFASRPWKKLLNFEILINSLSIYSFDLATDDTFWRNWDSRQVFELSFFIFRTRQYDFLSQYQLS